MKDAPKTLNISEPIRGFDPRAFLKARRPLLFSDSEPAEGIALPREVFEYHLETITSRKQEYNFEHFARKLIEKEVCPNLIPQTGPTGGGDGKVDSETYPVSEKLAKRWYHANALSAANERWAFAFSAMQDWRSKVGNDVKSIASTKRGYTRIFFVTNQFVRSKKRSEVEDKLSREFGVKVTILDRSWIVEKILENDGQRIAVDTLGISSAQSLETKKLGKLDAARQVELEDLERQINDPERYKSTSFQLAEDCLHAALIARGLDRPRHEVDATFERATRIAEEVGDPTQRLRVAYNRAWTAYWWFNDYKTFSTHYGVVEAIALATRDADHLDKLTTLYTILATCVRAKEISAEDSKIEARAAALRKELELIAADTRRPNAALAARTHLAFIEIHEKFFDLPAVEQIFRQLNEIIEKSRGLSSYPLESTIEIILELGEYFADNKVYDELFEGVLKLKALRGGELETGWTLLERGYQKLEGEKYYEAIQMLGRAQLLLARREHRNAFAAALFGCGIAYESVGLNWAARANMLVALNQAFAAFKETGSFPVTTPDYAIHLAGVELRLGRVPAILTWLEVGDLVASNVYPTEAEVQRFTKNRNNQDAVLSILLLRTDFWELKWLDFLPALLDDRGLFASWAALLYVLGYEEPIFDEFNVGCDTPEELKDFFIRASNQPVKKDLPSRPDFLIGSTLEFATILIGCRITVSLPNERQSVYFTETLLAALESLFATSIVTELYPIRSEFKVRIKNRSVSNEIEYIFEDIDDEEELIIKLPADTIEEKLADPVKMSDWLQDILIQVGVRVFYIADVEKWMKNLLVGELGLDRALNFSQVTVTLENILGKEFELTISDFRPEQAEKPYPVKRNASWDDGVALEEPTKARRVSDIELTPSEEIPSSLDPARMKHSDIKLESIIDDALWTKAGWSGMTYVFTPHKVTVPFLGLGFRDIEAGKAIFRKWRKRFGDEDVHEEIQITILTGIDKKLPASYRVVVGSDPRLDDTSGRLVLHMSRNCRMDPPDFRNLDMFVKLFTETKSYVLMPARFIDEHTAPEFIWDLGIKKSKISIKPYWKLNHKSLEIMGISREDDDPIEPFGRT